MYQSQNQRRFARELRSNQTDAEQKLWWALRKRQLAGCRFRRQFAVGPYIADFECHERRLVVELDGGQHNTANAIARDDERTRYLEAHGYRVLRFWNTEVMDDLEAVLAAIAVALEERAPGRPHPGPPPKGEGE